MADYKGVFYWRFKRLHVRSTLTHFNIDSRQHHFLPTLSNPLYNMLTAAGGGSVRVSPVLSAQKFNIQ